VLTPATPETWDLIESIERSTNAELTLSTLLAFAERFGVSSVFGGFVPPIRPVLPQREISQRILLLRLPSEWAARYAENGYLFRDPIVHCLQYGTLPFTWEQSYKSCSFKRDVKVIKGEAAEFGLRQGYVIPVATLDGHICGVSLGGDRLETSETDRAALNFVVSFAVGHLIGLRRKRYDVHGKKEFAEPVGLTSREYDCLLWAGEGKTDWEISKILAISRSTVIKHMLSAREKLGATNRSQLIVMAMRTRLLS